MKGRRVVAAALVAGAALLGAATAAWAATPQGGWTDPTPNGQAGGVPIAVLQTNGLLKGVAEFSQGIASVTFKLEKDATAGTDPCSAASGVQPQNKAGGGSTHVEFAFKATFPCNRRYEVSATVTPVQKPLRNDSDLVLDLFVDVAVPPPATTGLDAAVSGRHVALTWDAGRQTPDFEGFEIRRASGSGPFDALGDVGPGVTSYTDTTVPATGGTFHYRVVQIRTGPAAGTVVFGPDGSTADARVVPAPAETTTTEPSGGAGDGTTGSGGGGSNGDGSSAGGIAVLPTGHGTQSAHREFQVPGRTTPTTADSGFGQTLPFGKRTPGSSGGPGGSSAIANLDSGSGDDGKRQTLVLIAGGTTTFSWAMALRLISRRAAGI